jgi:hypothetical protein
MWNLWRRNSEQGCRRLRDAIEELAVMLAETRSVRNLQERLTEEDRQHLDACADCRDAAEELVAARELLQGAVSFGQPERPWFAARVMAAIASRERALAERMSAWTEIPRFASRLTWIAAIVLLVGTTWLYESVVRAPNYPLTGPPESIFEAPQQAPPDDILVSMSGDRP